MNVMLMGKMKLYVHENHLQYIKAGVVCMYLFMYACFYSVGISCRI
jgi:hypothetical protein